MKLNKRLRKLLLTLFSIIMSVGLMWVIPQKTTLIALVEKLDHVFYDLDWSWKFERQKDYTQKGDSINFVNLEDRIMVVDIDENSMNRLGNYNLWPRSYHADVIDTLRHYGATVIGVDILFSTADSGRRDTRRIREVLDGIMPPESLDSLTPYFRSYYNYDSLLTQSVSKAGNVINGLTLSSRHAFIDERWKRYTAEAWGPLLDTASLVNSQKWMPPVAFQKPLMTSIFPELYQNAARTALVNVIPDADGVHRSEPLFHSLLDSNGKSKGLYPTLALQMTLFVLGKDPDNITIEPGKHVDIGAPIHIWKDGEGNFQSSYKGLPISMIRNIISRKNDFRKFIEGRQGTLEIGAEVELQKDENGVPSAWANGEDLMPTIYKALANSPKARSLYSRVKKSKKPLKLNDRVEFFWEADEKAVYVRDLSDSLDEGVSLTEDALITLQESKDQMKTLPNNETLMVASSLVEFSWRNRPSAFSPRKELYTPFIILTENVLESILETPLSQLNQMKPGDSLALGNPIRIPIDPFGRSLLNFRSPGKSAFRTVPYHEVRDSIRKDPKLFAHKIVLLGSTAHSLMDIVSAPGNDIYPGVMIHATLLNSMLTNNFITHSPTRTIYILAAIMAILTAFTAFYFRPFLSALAVIIYLVGFWFYAFFQFAENNIYHPVAIPLLTILITYILSFLLKYIFEEREKRQAVDAFKSYISPELIDEMLDKDQKPQLGGVESELTAYFTDIASFSTFSEKIGSPSRLVELLNEYLTAMTDILLGHTGTLDKYEGDAIIAFFGAPVPLDNHAKAACLTALAMQDKLGELREKWESEGDKWPQIVHHMRMRIGLNTGQIVTGNMGSALRMNYTMMGDAVNLAARLESGAKQYGVYTMCSRETLNSAGEGFLYRVIDSVRVVGKSEPVEVCELLATEENASAELNTLAKTFAEARENYRQMNWDKAHGLFEECLKLEPHHPERAPGCYTTPSHVFIQRCEEYKENPPVAAGETWDGVYTATSK